MGMGRYFVMGGICPRGLLSGDLFAGGLLSGGIFPRRHIVEDFCPATIISTANIGPKKRGDLSSSSDCPGINILYCVL